MRPSLPLSISLISAVVVQLACQAFKVVYYSIQRRKLSLSYFFTAGGIPSAHSALVTALSISIGLWDGFHSELFAVSCVFTLIVIYDAIRLRGAVQQHAKVLKLLAARHPDVQTGELSEMVGHTLGEIIVGIVVGGGFAALVYVLVSRLM
jgi:acid phosphatase family membrane protein YuiD